MGGGIHIISTGGTIESVWNGSKDTVVVAEKSVLPEYFANLTQNLKFYEEFAFTQACMKDSRDITDEDRKNILEIIEDGKFLRVILMHGTYTIPHTARFLKANIKRKDQTIILMGSITPIKGFDYSDAPINIGYAIAQTQILSPGVYVCMNARVFTPQEVAKNIELGQFYSLIRK